ncbi:hypothetical protein ACN38_g10819, partial [Penicillium nordicum]
LSYTYCDRRLLPSKKGVRSDCYVLIHIDRFFFLNRRMGAFN